MTYESMITILWLMFLSYWLVYAVGMKKNIRNNKNTLIRLILIVILFLIWSNQTFERFIGGTELVPNYAFLSFLGVILCACGIFLAVWARKHLGKNWGTPMSEKEDPELITSGPYALSRHPIYAGIMLAMLGSALVSGNWWIILFLIFSAYFISSAKVEEKIMQKRFPKEYPAYKAKTKMLIPFLF